jgi:hypothetical protein
MTSDGTPVLPSLSPVGLRAAMASAARYWEPHRIAYNVVLVGVLAYWVIRSWPQLRPALHLAPCCN